MSATSSDGTTALPSLSFLLFEGALRGIVAAGSFLFSSGWGSMLVVVVVVWLWLNYHNIVLPFALPLIDIDVDPRRTVHMGI